MFTAKAAVPKAPSLVSPAAAKRAFDPVVDVAVDPNAFVGANIRATAVLYRAAVLDEMKLFDVADGIASESKGRATKLGASAQAKIAAYDAPKGRLTKRTRADFGELVTQPSQLVFEAIVESSIEQMRAYADLVASVSQSASDFMKDNTSESQERDTLADRFGKASGALGLTLTHRGYGGAHYAASALAEQIKDAIALLSDPELQGAFGAKSMHDLIAQRTGKTAADVASLDRRATAGAALIEGLAANVELLSPPSSADPSVKKKHRELAKRLASLGAQARDWKSASSATRAPSKKLTLLCFDADRRVVPCNVKR